MRNQITPCLWFDNKAEEAAAYYISIFKNSKIEYVTHYGKEGYEEHGQKEGTVLTIDFSLNGQLFTAFNGGPHFKFNPSVSFYVVCETENEITGLWERLSEGGSILMPLDKYEWSERYGWVGDRYGLTWQLSLGKLEDTGQKISPALLFMGSHHHQAEEAVHFYTTIFPDSGVRGILKYGDGGTETPGTVKHAQFTLKNQTFMIMGNSKAHDFEFNEAISFQVFCDTQDQIDYFWNKLSYGGGEGKCGWLRDMYGISWQVIPAALRNLLNNPDKSDKVMKALLKMKKYDIAKLLKT